MSIKKYKVIGSYTTHKFYSQVIEVDESLFSSESDLLQYVDDLAREDGSEGLDNWSPMYEEVVGDGFYIDEIKRLS